MRDIFIGVGFLLWGLCRFLIVMPLVAIGRGGYTVVRRKASQIKQRQPSIAVNSPAHALVAETGPATIIQASAYDVADRIVSIRLDPPVGVINLRVYTNARVVKRDLIISEPRLKALMRGRRHTFPDAPYDSIEGLDGLKDETVEIAEALINTLGNQSVKAVKTQKLERVAKSPVAAAPPAAVAAQGSEAERPDGLDGKHRPATADRNPESGKVYAPKPHTGITYVGSLVAAGTETMTPKGRVPYETFQAVLLLDNGVEMPLRGGELERELTGAQCQVGQRIAITPMGKVPVSLANGDEGSKNLYRVQNLSKPGRA